MQHVKENVKINISLFKKNIKLGKFRICFGTQERLLKIMKN